MFSTQLSMAVEESKHRMKLPLYDLEPKIENCFVAPNSTIGKNLQIFITYGSWRSQNKTLVNNLV